MVNRRGVRFNGEERQAFRVAAAEAHKEGASPAEIAQRLGCSDGSVRTLLVEAGITDFNTHWDVRLPEGMLTSTEAAALIGITRGSLLALRNRGEAPPIAERPAGTHGRYTYWWRTDVEKWLSERAERRLKRARDQEARKRAGQERLAACAFPEFVMDWNALLKAVDEKRQAEGFSWRTVSRLCGVHEGHISRIRKGVVPSHAFGAFARLAFWAAGSVPDEIKRFTVPTEEAG